MKDDARDRDQLRLLALGHRVVGAVTAVAASFPLLHVTIGLTMIFAPDAFGEGGDPPPPFFGVLFTVIPALMIAVGWALAIATWRTAKKVERRESWTRCAVVAGLNCLMMPFGTVLGVFSLIVLNRPSVRRAFGEAAAGGEPEPVGARPRAGGTRCPFCREEAAPDAGDVVACTECLSRHHAACWDEHGACASCGGAERFAGVEATGAPRRRAPRREPPLKG